MNLDYSIAIYLRISLGDGDESNAESESITNQRNLLHSFILRDAELSNRPLLEFCDDGYSGTTFNRPAVMALLEQVRRGIAGCIIVKDFSRFGRNYVEVGEYLEQIFPLLGVRFISVNDGYDSHASADFSIGLDISFKNLIYSMYSKDLSTKIKSGKKAAAQRGLYTNPSAPFGYVLEGKNTLAVDREAADIVCRIFQMKIDGLATSQIARALNDGHIPTPSVYKRRKGDRRNWHVIKEENHWNGNAVRLILRDERYMGKAVYGKKTRVEVGNTAQRQIAVDEWVTVPGTHEAIITEQDFALAQAKMQKFTQRDYRPPSYNILRGLVRCGYCKHMLTRTQAGGGAYICRNKLYTGDIGCSRVHITQSSLETAVLATAGQFLMLSDKARDIVHDRLSQISQEIKRADLRIGRCHLLKIEAYENYHRGKAERDTYLSNRTSLDSQIEGYTSELEHLNELSLKYGWILSENSYDGILLGANLRDCISTIYIHDRDTISFIFSPITAPTDDDAPTYDDDERR